MLELDFTLSLPGFSASPRIAAAGGITALFGPSGAGKSLTVQCVAGLVRPDAGRIVIGRQIVFDSRAGVDLPPRRRQVGYVPQDYALFPHLDVAGNVGFGLRDRPRSRARLAVAEMLGCMELGGLESRRVSQLSGGQRQRVALARALVRRPEVLLLDEPFAALDAPVRVQLRRLVRDLQRRFGPPTLFITHDLSEAGFVADRLAVLVEGRVRQVGPPQEVLMRPADLEVARAVGVKNVLAGRVRERTPAGLAVEVGAALLETPPYPFGPGERVHLCVRPERVFLQRKDRPSPPGANQLEGEIVEEASEGLNCTLGWRCRQRLGREEAASDLQIDLPLYVYERLGIGSDRSWTVSIPPGAIHLLGTGAADPA